MKKSNIVIIVLCVLVLLFSGVFAVKYVRTQKNDPSAVNGDFTESEQKKKAKELPNAVRLIEEEDFFLSGGSAEQSEIAEDSLAFLSDSVFDEVFLRIKSFSFSKDSSLSAKKEKAALNFCKNAKITGRRMFTRYALILFHLLNIIKLVLGKEGECE